MLHMYPRVMLRSALGLTAGEAVTVEPAVVQQLELYYLHVHVIIIPYPHCGPGLVMRYYLRLHQRQITVPPMQLSFVTCHVCSEVTLNIPPLGLPQSQDKKWDHSW